MNRVVLGLREDDYPEDRDEGEGRRHAQVHPGIHLLQPVPAEREPVDAVGGEGQRRHVQRRRGGEGTEQGEPEEEVGAGEELAEPGHPDAPDTGPEVDARVALGEAQ